MQLLSQYPSSLVLLLLILCIFPTLQQFQNVLTYPSISFNSRGRDAYMLFFLFQSPVLNEVCKLASLSKHSVSSIPHVQGATMLRFPGILEDSKTSRTGSKSATGNLRCRDFSICKEHLLIYFSPTTGLLYRWFASCHTAWRPELSSI